MFTISTNTEDIKNNIIQRVMKPAENAQRSNLMKFGGYCRMVAVNSLKQAAKKAAKKAKQNQTSLSSILGGKKDAEVYSKPGDPPLSKLGLIQKFIRFAYDPHTKSVVIGPEAIGGHKTISLRVLEYGGVETLLMGNGRKVVTAKYQPRPYMRPAFGVALKKIPEIWKDSIKPI